MLGMNNNRSPREVVFDLENDFPAKPNNIMWDKRVFRGSTYAMDNSFITNRFNNEPHTQTTLSGGHRNKDHTLFNNTTKIVVGSQNPSENPSSLSNILNWKAHNNPFKIPLPTPPKIEINLEKNLVDQRTPPQKNEEFCQTDEFFDLPPPVPYLPAKLGLDAATQVGSHENSEGPLQMVELFDFNREVAPLIHVICSKTLEQAILEVEEEEELIAMEKFRTLWTQRLAATRAEEDELLSLEKQRKAELDKVLLEKRAEHTQKLKLLKKLVAVRCSHEFVHVSHNNNSRISNGNSNLLTQGSILSRVVDNLAKLNVYVMEESVEMESVYFKSLVERSSRAIQHRDVLKTLVEECLGNSITQIRNKRREAVNAKFAEQENCRLEKVAIIEAARERERLRLEAEERERQRIIEENRMIEERRRREEEEARRLKDLEDMERLASIDEEDGDEEDNEDPVEDERDELSQQDDDIV